ncbi:MAG TPA: hypothetical protein VGP25_20305 [Gemmatimonadaceae bacterium]|nr:hypothetical protein [Gemmatimonadaceae bacterium]
MRKLLIGLLLIVACTSRTTVTPVTVGSGATGPRSALDAFLAAVRAKDLQQLGAVWGDKEGAIRDSKRISRDDLEKRELLLMCYFGHETYKVLSDAPAVGGERVMSVSLTKGTLTRTTNFYLVGGSDRWYVRTADIEPVRDLCNNKKK